MNNKEEKIEISKKIGLKNEKICDSGLSKK